MSVRELSTPLRAEDLATLDLGDQVFLTGEVFASAGIPTYQRLLDCVETRQAPPFDLRGAALFHLGSIYEETDDGRREIVYLNPTTSTRFNDKMPRLIEGFGLRATGGKGGLSAESAAAMARAGCVYLSFLGGGAQILTDAVRAVSGVGWPEMIEHYRLVRLEVDRLGPLTVGITARGESIYDRTAEEAARRRSAILARLRHAREGLNG
jgi:fumarate hydratase subunit beta